MSKGPIGRGFKRARDINSTYSLFDRALQIVGSCFPGAIAGSLAGVVLSNVTWFWAQYGIVGVIVASALFGVIVIAVQLAAEFRLLGSAGSDHVPVLAGSPHEVSGLKPEAMAAGSRPYIEVAAVFAGAPFKHAHYKARFARSGGGTFFLRYCGSNGDTDGGWTRPQVMKLLTVDRFVRGEVITIPLTSAAQAVLGEVWYFGAEQQLVDGQYPNHGIAPTLYYRGRVTFVSSDDEEQHCHFLVVSGNVGEQPVILGEHMWSHEHTWENRAPPAGNANSLYT